MARCNPYIAFCHYSTQERRNTLQTTERIIKEIESLSHAITYLNEDEARIHLDKNIDLFFDLSMKEVALADRSFVTIYFLLNDKFYAYLIVMDELGKQIGAYFFWDTNKSLAEHSLCETA